MSKQILALMVAVVGATALFSSDAHARVKAVPYDPDARVVNKQFVLWGGGQYATFATDLAPELGGFVGVRLSPEDKKRHTQLGLGMMMAKEHGIFAGPDASYRLHVLDSDNRIVYLGTGVQLRFLALDKPDNAYVGFGLSAQGGMWLKPRTKGSVFVEARLTQNVPLMGDATGVYSALGEAAPFNPGSLRTELSAFIGVAF